MELSHLRGAGSALGSGVQRSAKHATAFAPPVVGPLGRPICNNVGQVIVEAASFCAFYRQPLPVCTGRTAKRV